MEGKPKHLTKNFSGSFELDIKKAELDLELAQKEAQLRAATSSQSMNQDINHLRNIESTTKQDYRMHSTYETASGRTEVTIEKRSNLGTIVFAIVVAVIVFVVFGGR